MPRETVLVLGGRHTALAATRELTAGGYGVVVGDAGYYSVVRHSRYCREIWAHPPATDGEGLIDALATFLTGRPDITHVLPLDDRSAGVIASQRDRLPDDVVLVVAGAATVETCLDKQRMYEIATELDVPHAPVILASDRSQLVSTADRAGYPCVVRPVVFGGRMPAQRKAMIFESAAQIGDALTTWPEAAVGLLVQRYVTGLRHDVWFVAREGRLLATLQAVTTRTDMADGTGLRMDGHTVSRDPRLHGYLEAMVERLRYDGVGGAQFIVDEQGEASFLEINPRPSGSGLPLLRRCGLPHALAAVSVASGTGGWQPEPDFDYRVGTRSAWTSRDLLGLGRAITRREVGPRAAARWLWATIETAVRADVHQVWDRRDPMPALATWAHLLTLGPWRRSRRRA